MFDEDGEMVEVSEVREAVRNADVLIVGFRAFPQRLLVDSRTAEAAGPMVRVVEPLAGVEERMWWLGRNRPQFGMPQRFTFFVWPHSVGFLEETGVADSLRETVAQDDGPQQLSAGLGELHALERAARRAAVDGEPWRTIWRAHGTSRSR